VRRTCSCADGLPPPPAAPSIAPQDLSGSFRAVDVNFKSTRVQQFNVQVGERIRRQRGHRRVHRLAW
jgi:hypothetical protein